MPIKLTPDPEPAAAPDIGEASPDRASLTVALKPRHLAWIAARAAAHGQTTEEHASALLTRMWQTDEWRLAQSAGATQLKPPQ